MFHWERLRAAARAESTLQADAATVAAAAASNQADAERAELASAEAHDVCKALQGKWAYALCGGQVRPHHHRPPFILTPQQWWKARVEKLGPAADPPGSG
jgi:hypothetical protein